MLPIESDEDLHGQLALVDEIYDRLGEVGRDFIGTLKAIGTYEHYQPDYTGAAAYYGVGRTQFLNTILYGPRAIAHDLPRLFTLRTHEGIHAVQAFTLAASHASPLNTRSTVVLCPRDYIKLNELMERGAYSGQLLFELLRRDVEAGNADNKLLSISDLADPSNEALVEDTKAQMRQLADKIMALGKLSLKDEYNARALANYEEAMAEDRATELARGELRFVRLEEEDIAAAGNGFILNLFTDNDDRVLQTFMDPVPLSPELEARVQELNKMLGIKDESNLPTFGEALAEAGSDREHFITASIRGAPSVPILRPQNKPPPGPAPI